MPEPTPEAWAQIRHDYEHTDKPLAHICAEHEITIPMMRYRMKRWEWTRRKPLIPRQGPPPVAVMTQSSSPGEAKRNPGAADTFAPDFASLHPGYEGPDAPPHPTPPPPGEGEAPTEIVPRLQAAAARVLPAIEATIARLASGTLNPADLEKAGRTLATLTRTLRELNAQLAQHNARGDDMRCECREMSPEDADAFRDQLARRIDAFLTSREGGIPEPGSALPLDVQK